MGNKLFGILNIGNFYIIKNPTKRELKSVRKIVEEKDTPIFISAIKNSDFLLTLDKGFFKKEIIDFAKSHKLIVLQPREFIKFIK